MTDRFHHRSARLSSRFAWTALSLLAACTDTPRTFIFTPESAWVDQGFVQITPAVPLPSQRDDLATVEIWAKLPTGAHLGRLTEDGEPRLVWPPGAIVDRVERSADAPRRVVDVRGVEIGVDGARTWRLFRPMTTDPDDPLVGVLFPSGDDAAHDRAIAALRADVARSERVAAMTPERQARHLTSLTEKSGCDGCHVPSRPEHAPGALVRRGTDHAGLFTPQYALTDHAPVEVYGVDRTDDAPFVRVRCDDGRSPVADGSRGALRCEDTSRPRAHRDVPAGLAASDPETLALCRTRAWLLASLDPTSAARRDTDSCTSLTALTGE